MKNEHLLMDTAQGAAILQGLFRGTEAYVDLAVAGALRSRPIGCAEADPVPYPNGVVANRDS